MYRLPYKNSPLLLKKLPRRKKIPYKMVSNMKDGDVEEQKPSLFLVWFFYLQVSIIRCCYTSVGCIEDTFYWSFVPYVLTYMASLSHLLNLSY